MTREEFVEDVKLSLGYPVVDIELDDSLIGKTVDRAFREVKRYITETRFVTIPYSTTGIDVSKYRINSIIQIFRTQNPAGNNYLTDVFSFGASASSSVQSGSTGLSDLLLSDYTYRTQVNQLKSTIETDLDFTFDKHDQKLYINAYHPRPSKVTLAYIPEFKDVSEVMEQYWINYIQRMALALTKEALGRVRSKYELSSSLYKLDGNQLISEGISERDAIRQELDENSDIVFPID